ncbi:MAG TPA: hypothetical protein VKQ07_05785 [Jatrophihabitantaceae bacterium]|jgi:hypothetical protein|nr:hypothetical protein [Jatrophihabitantaceae bacterium]
MSTTTETNVTDLYISKLNALVTSDREDLIAGMLLDYDRARDEDRIAQERSHPDA